MKKDQDPEFMIKELHYKLLKHINDNPGTYQSKMKVCTYSHSSYITRKFILNGWIYVKQNGNRRQRRAKQLFITRFGKEVLKAVEKIEALKQS